MILMCCTFFDLYAGRVCSVRDMKMILIIMMYYKDKGMRTSRRMDWKQPQWTGSPVRR